MYKESTKVSILGEILCQKNLMFLKQKKVIMIDSEGQERIIIIDEIEKLKSIVDMYNLIGHVGKENCSGADIGVSIEFRSSMLGPCKKILL